MKILTRNYPLTLVVVLLGLAACTTAGRPDIAGMSFSESPIHGKMIWYDLITEDIDSARNFYGGLFGWTFEEAEGSRGEDYLVVRHGNTYVAGMVAFEGPDDNENYSRWLPYMSVANVDSAITSATSAGASVAAEARDVGFGRVAAVIDPQGAVIGLAKSDLGDPDDITTAAAPGRPVWTELLADNPGAAATFYASLAPYSVRSFSRNGGEYTVLDSSDKPRAGIFQNPADGDYSPVWLTAFGVEDPAAAAAKAVALGGSIILPVSPELRDSTTAVITDPSGAILVLQLWSRDGAEQ